MDYFCTCGRGTEVFAVNELRLKFVNCAIRQRDGKVFLSLKNVTGGAVELADKLCDLRTVERLFVSVLDIENFDVLQSKQIAWRLKSSVEKVDPDAWNRSFDAWKLLQCRSKLKSHHTEPAYRQGGTSQSPEVVVTVEGKQLCNSRAPSEQATISSSDRPGTHVSDDVQSRKRHMDESVTFRVSAKCSGLASNVFDSQKLSRFLGPLIARVTGWIPDLRKPLLEVYVQLNNDGLLIGLSATRVPLSCRPYLKHAGLRTTVASAMISLAALQPGMVILDPMCGEATILVEAAKQYTGLLCIGCDVSLEQCTAAVENMQFANEHRAVDILQGSVTDLPFGENYFDAVLCDVPFGSKHSSFQEVCNLLPDIVCSIDRVVKVGGHVVLLVGASSKDRLLGVIDSLRETKNAAFVDTETDSLFGDGISSTDISAAESTVVCSEVDCRELPADGIISKDFTSLITSSEGGDRGSVTAVSQCCSAAPRGWSNNLVNYVKLGETHGYICHFTKNG